MHKDKPVLMDIVKAISPLSALIVDENLRVKPRLEIGFTITLSVNIEQVTRLTLIAQVLIERNTDGAEPNVDQSCREFGLDLLAACGAINNLLNPNNKV